MTTQEYDTDPSTPGAKRLSDPRAGVAEPFEGTESATSEDSAVASARMRPTTDPGIAPPAQPLPVPVEPMGIVVPPAARTPNDSVDALLEGIRREAPDRRGIPQTDGQTAAAYHSEHKLRRAQVAPQEPKVVIERPVLAQTQRIRIRGSHVTVGDLGARDSTDVTSVASRRVFARMAIAVFAGVGVVMLIFVALQRISSQVATVRRAEPPVATAIVSQPALPATQTAAPSAVPVTETPAPAKSAGESQPAPSASVASVTSAIRKPATAPKPNKPKAKPAPSATKMAGEDLGEFKSAF